MMLGVTLVITLVLAIAPFAHGQDTVGPPPPTGLSATERQEDLGLRVTLSWNHRQDCFGYKVYRSEKEEGPYDFIGGKSGESTEDYPFFLDDNAESGATYYYRVAAVDGQWQEGPLSTAVRVESPSYLRATQASKRIVVSLADQRVYCFEDGVVVNIFRCSTGASGTPTGNFSIYAHHRVMGVGSCVCDFWMDWKPRYGMHSWPRWSDGYRDYEESLGVRPRSHGCIRLHPLEAYWPYYWAPDGTPMTVMSGSFGHLPLKGCNSSTGTTAPSKDWYFAEGFTGGDFVERLLLFNPGSEPACAVTTYYPDIGGAVTEQYVLQPGARETVSVNGVAGLPPSSHATVIHADREIVAEREEFFEYGGRRGGHSSTGAPAPSKQWYFAEGYTGNLFDTYLLLFNPNKEAVRTEVTYYREDGWSNTDVLELPALSRRTLLVNAVPDLLWHSLSMKVESEEPVVAERAVYFGSVSPNGINGGHCSVGLDGTSTTWYLAEGCTGHLFDEYILILNPNPEPVEVNIIFFLGTGPYGYKHLVAPNSRATIPVDSIPGLEFVDTPAFIAANTEIVVERTMYYAKDSRRGGSGSTGIAETSRDWYFAGGYTGGTFDEYILLLNTTGQPANAFLRFHVEDGPNVDHGCVVPPNGRATIHVDDIPGLEFAYNAVEIHTDVPVAAERSQFFCVPRPH